MFNITVTRQEYARLKQTLNRLGVETCVDTQFTEGRQRYVDVTVGTPGQRYSRRIVNMVSRLQLS